MFRFHLFPGAFILTRSRRFSIRVDRPKIVEAQYEAGKFTMLQVLQIQAREISSLIALTRIQNARRAQCVDLHLASGGDFE